MSALLRSSRLVLISASRRVNRGLALNSAIKPWLIREHVIVKSNYSAFAVVNNSEQTLKEPHLAADNERRLDRELLKLDLEARKNGRLSKIDVQMVIDVIEATKSVTGVQSLLLIRCCGALVPSETSSGRIKLTEKVWTMLKEINSPMDVSHYNALLKVHLENQHDFQPSDFLALMEKDNIKPNRVTYQRLIGRYCQMGDIEGASKILEFMKSESLPVNEFVFNELIFGHAKNNDMKGARDMLEVMRGAKLEPTSQSYKVLACGYGLQGNIEAINDTLAEAKNQDIYLQDRDIMDIIMTLANSGHAGKANQLFSSMSKSTGYNQECINCILELLCSGHHKLGFELLMTMPRPTRPDGTLAPAGVFFIKQLVATETNIETILNYVDQLKSINSNADLLQLATKSALYESKMALSMDLIGEMASRGLPIRHHYFWPLFRMSRDTDQVYSVVQLMLKLACLPNYETIQEYMMPHFDQILPKDVIAKLKDLGISVVTAVNPVVLYLLDQGKPKEAAELLTHFPVRLTNRLTLKGLAACYSQSENSDVQSITAILKHVRDNPEISADQVLRNDVCGQFILDCIANGVTDKLEPLLAAMLSQELYISRSAVDMVHLKSPKAPELSPLLEKLSSLDFEAPLPDNDAISHPREMKVEDLESHLLELCAKGMNTRGVLRRLFMIHCREKNYDRVVEIKKELDEDNAIYSGAMNAQLLSLYTALGKTQEAMELYTKLCTEEPDFEIDTFKVINLATLLVKENCSKEALEILDSFQPKRSTQTPMNLERNIFRLLCAGADKGDVPLTRKLFELTVVKAEYNKPTNILLGQLIKVHLNNNEDLDGAIKEFENCVANYRSTPLKNELFHRLIELEDTDRLQKILDQSTQIHGEINVLYDLTCAFIDCGKIKQARKVMETPGLRAIPNRLDNLCENYIFGNKITELEQFVDVTKNLFNIDRDRMYYHLLTAYVNANDASKALNLWTEMQENDIHPTPKTLIHLGNFLKRNNQEIPFQIPQQSEWEELNTKEEKKSEISRVKVGDRFPDEPSLTQKSKRIETLVQEQKLDAAIEETSKMLQVGVYPSPQIFRFLLSQLSRQGLTAKLESLQRITPDAAQKKINFKCFVGISRLYANDEAHVEIAAELETKYFDNINAFPKEIFINLLERYPEYEDKMKRLMERFDSECDFLVPKNLFWIHLMKQQRHREADEIIKYCPQLIKSENFLFRNVCLNAVKEKSLDLSHKLVAMVETYSAPSVIKGEAYGALITVHVSRGETDEALSILKSSLEKLQLTHIPRKALYRLRKQLRDEGKPIPFAIPAVTRKEDTSSSSDD